MHSLGMTHAKKLPLLRGSKYLYDFYKVSLVAIASAVSAAIAAAAAAASAATTVAASVTAAAKASFGAIFQRAGFLDYQGASVVVGVV